MNNLDLYEKVRKVPQNAQKAIGAGRLKGFTDINPMWRIKMLTEQFGPCGQGWYTEIKREWTEAGSDGRVAAFMDIDLRVKNGNDWSLPISGTGGSMFTDMEQKGAHSSDEAYKMAYTDALSVCCKMLGFGADVYWDKDDDKYTKGDNQPDSNPDTNPIICADCQNPITDTKSKKGTLLPAAAIAEYSQKRFGRQLCSECQKKAEAALKANEAT